MYTTVSKYQAQKWARKKYLSEPQYNPLIYVLDYKENAELSLLDFGTEYTAEWLRFVYRCKFIKQQHAYDLVSGRCALKTLNSLLTHLKSDDGDNLTDAEVEVLLTQTIKNDQEHFTQLAFCSDRAVSCLSVVQVIDKMRLNCSTPTTDELDQDIFNEILLDIVSYLTEHISTKYHYPYETALSLLYRTQTYTMLQNQTTSLWDRGPICLKHTLDLEITTGDFQFPD